MGDGESVTYIHVIHPVWSMMLGYSKTVKDKNLSD